MNIWKNFSTGMDVHDRVIEIIVYLVNEMRNNKSFGEIDLRVLEENGYTQTEISNACSWLSEKLAGSDFIVPFVQGQTDRSHRILHDVERMVITLEAQGYLLQLRELGILSAGMFEAVIDRAMMSGYSSVGIEEIKAIVSTLVFEKDEMRKLDNRYFSPWSDTIH